MATLYSSIVRARPTPWMRRFWLRAELVMLVTTTDDFAFLDSYTTSSRVGDAIYSADIRMLANQCDSDTIAADVLAGDCRRQASGFFLVPWRHCQRCRGMSPVQAGRDADAVRGVGVAKFRFRSCDAVAWPCGVRRAAAGLRCACAGARFRNISSRAEFSRNVERNDSSRSATNADNVRHHTGVPVCVKLAEMRRI